MEYALRDLQLSILELMVEFKRICDKHNLSYILYGGTCLGTVRHNGFIPWDDDADFAMARDDYEKFKEICKSGELNDKYVFQDFDEKKEPHYIDGWVRIRKKNTLCVIDYHKDFGYNELGVFVDVFPLDYVNVKRGKDIDIIVKKYQIRQRLFNSKIAKKHPTFKSKISYLATLFTSAKHLYIKRENTCQKNNSKTANYLIDFNNNINSKQLLPLTICQNTIDHLFEGVLFKIPADYHIMLTSFYGNYMELPPKEKRMGHLPKEIKL